MASVSERSVGHLQTLYSLVIGLALTEAVSTFVLGPEHKPLSGSTNQTQAWPMFLAFMATLVPFFHGANRYLDQTYIFQPLDDPPIRPRNFTLLVDFIILFVEAGIFYWMALVLTHWQQFFWVLIYLLAIDMAWLAFNLIYGTRQKALIGWLCLNAGAVALMWIVMYTPLLPEAHRSEALMGITVVRTVFDYIWNWKYFYP